MRAFVPAKIKDNPSVNREEYVRNLKHLGPVVRERLMNGDWTIMPTGAIKAAWLRYFSLRGKDIVQLLKTEQLSNGDTLHTDEVVYEFDCRECRRFVTIDTAGGTKDLTKAAKGKGYSWTVAGVWDHKVIGAPWKESEGLDNEAKYSGDSTALLLRYVWRAQCGFMDVAKNLMRINDEWRPHTFRVEDKTMGPDLCDMLRGKLNISTIGTGTEGKMERNFPFQNMMSRGEVYLPKYENSGWKSTYEAELLSWQGLEGETNDQIDMSSYAAIEIGSYTGTTIPLDFDPRDIIEPIKDSELAGGWIGRKNKGGIAW